MSEAYDIAAIYAEMEKEIISSMQRNLSGHIEEEKRVGFDYPQWQAEKLKSLRRYQIENAKIIHSYTDGLPLKVKAILQGELKQGALNELKKYKEAMAAGYESSVVMKDSFFKINTRKVNNLIKSVDNDLAKANQACLRYVDDAYRQVIFKSEMFVANGVYTEKKAVDKAIEEFEKRGLHCIEYANGSYHDIADYADMAVKTASQRAQLMGEGEFRKKVGNSLIKISKHGGTCPLCAKWEGRVLIDDVYSGGTPADGNYPLLSEAMAAGLYHPRCRHGAGTYYPEVDDIWNDIENNKTLENNSNSGIIKSNDKDSSAVIKPSGKEHSNRGSSRFSEKSKQILLDHEKDTCTNEIESAMLMDENGSVVFHKNSQKTNQVIFSQKEISSMYNGVLTHNHSNGTTFTANDVYMLIRGNLNEMRASTEEGAYVIRPPVSGNKHFNSVEQIDDLLYEYEKEYSQKNYNKLLNKELSMSEYLSHSQQYSVEKFCKENGFEYFFESR